MRAAGDGDGDGDRLDLRVGLPSGLRLEGREGRGVSEVLFGGVRGAGVSGTCEIFVGVMGSVLSLSKLASAVETISAEETRYSSSALHAGSSGACSSKA